MHLEEHFDIIAERLGALESKLPAYVTGERFVPFIDECYIVRKSMKGYVADDYLDWLIVQDGQWIAAVDGWTGTFHKTQAEAQAEADRLNEEGA